MKGYGELLRIWRQARSLSQLALSGMTGVSQRYLSYLETQKAHPSRSMVAALADALNVPDQIRAQMLFAADYAPAETPPNLSAACVAATRQGLMDLLDAQDPIPSVLVDRIWNIQEYNSGFERLLSHFGETKAILSNVTFQGHPNLLKLFYLTAGLCSHVTNGSQVGRQALARLNLHALQAPDDSTLVDLINDLRSLGESPMDWWDLPADMPSEIGELHLERNETTIRCAVLVSAFGSLQETSNLGWRIITYLPLDASTRTLFNLPISPTQHDP